MLNTRISDSSRKRIIILGFGWMLLLLADQFTKNWAADYLKTHDSITLIPDILEFYYVENRGMSFGLFAGRQWLFILFGLIFLIFLSYACLKIPKNRYYLPVILTGSLIGAGAAGNMIDRIMRGYVVDFIYFSIINFPVFNLADIYVVCGCIGMVILILFYYSDGDFSFITDKAGDSHERNKINSRR